jgi:hypothetical protein
MLGAGLLEGSGELSSRAALVVGDGKSTGCSEERS